MHTFKNMKANIAPENKCQATQIVLKMGKPKVARSKIFPGTCSNRDSSNPFIRLYGFEFEKWFCGNAREDFVVSVCIRSWKKISV